MSKLKYCMNCRQKVSPARKVGFGTFVMILITGFIWIIFVPLYPKVCPICKGNHWGIRVEFPSSIPGGDDEKSMV